MGGPGSGKGTICKKLVNDFNYKLISAGDLLREEKASGSELGKEIATLIDAGNLVPDETITKILYNQFKQPIEVGRYFLIDGYPRTLNQALSLDQMINTQIVLWINVSDETTIKRNLNRGLTSGRPDDANEDIIKKRLDNYKEMSIPIKRYYDDCIVEIDGEGTPDEVYQRIIDTLFENVKEPRDVSDILDEE
jgi:adenylate kinase family enzyme